MRIALISDIHGNCFALDTALADLDGQAVDQIICLGDAIQGGPQPAETIQKLRELTCPIVLGNADAWLLAEEHDTAEPTSPQQREVRRWTLSQLSADDLAFIRGFPPTVDLTMDDGQRLLCFHGSPISYNDILLPTTPDEEWHRLLGPYAPAIMTGATRTRSNCGASTRDCSSIRAASVWPMTQMCPTTRGTPTRGPSMPYSPLRGAP